jgi:hypothetical protein
MGGPEASGRQVRLYALADLRAIAASAADIEKAILAALHLTPGRGNRISVSAMSGWISYTAAGELWERSSAPVLPAEREEAVKKAEDVLVRLNEHLSDRNPRWPARLKGISLMPPLGLVRRASLAAVARPDGSAFDHWLYRGEPHLYLDEAGEVRSSVLGAQIEVRIGNGGMPVAVRSRWRPLSGERKLVDLSSYVPPPAIGGEDEHGRERDVAPSVRYVLDGDGVPQYYLAPYYCSPEHSGVEIVSASSYSLTVHMARTDQDARRMTVSAFARGGSGDYAYDWACYPLPHAGKGIRLLGAGSRQLHKTRAGTVKGSSIRIDRGLYVIMVNVRDRATGAFRHAQRQVFPVIDFERRRKKVP